MSSDNPPYNRQLSQPLPPRPLDSQLRRRPPSYPTFSSPRSTLDRVHPKESKAVIARTPSVGRHATLPRSSMWMRLALRRTALRRLTFNGHPSTTTKECVCVCRCEAGSVIREVKLTMSSEDLSWRQLHMSRAKLKATAGTSQLLSGFAMIAMIELQIANPTTAPEWLFIMYSISTTLLVAVHIFALMISTYLLPNVDAIGKLHYWGMIGESPHVRMRGFIELAWAFSTLLGLFLFLFQLGVLTWVKFWDTSFEAAWASTIILIPVLVIFLAFAVYFYHVLVVVKVKEAVIDIRELEDLRLQLDTGTRVDSF